MGSGPTVACLGYELFSGSLDQLPRGKQVTVNTINQYSYCLAQEDSVFKKALLRSDVLLPDGVGMVIASKWLSRQKIKKIAGADLHCHLLHKLEREKGSCFYMGSSEKTLKLIAERISKEFPNIRVGSYSPPFKTVFSEEDNKAIISAVNTFKPDVLFVGMTAPKQEKWSFTHYKKLDVGLVCSIGAVFDFYAGTVQRPGKFWVSFGLEWLGRLLKEPKRMWKRYIYYGVIFGFYLFREKLLGYKNRRKFNNA